MDDLGSPTFLTEYLVLNRIMRKLFLFALLAFVCVCEDAIFEMGTPEHPKENLPFNDDVTVKTLVHSICCFHSSICLRIVRTWLLMVTNWAFTILFVLWKSD